MARRKYNPPERVSIRLKLHGNTLLENIEGLTRQEETYEYVGSELEKIAALLPMDEGVLIIPDSLYLAGRHVECWSCKEVTPAIVPFTPGAYFGFLDQGEPEFHYLNTAVRIHTPKELPTVLKEYIISHLPFYKIGKSKTTGVIGWNNHCVHCGKLQGDFFLHSEPEEGFWLMYPEDATDMPMVRFELPEALVFPHCPDHSEWIQAVEQYGAVLSMEKFSETLLSVIEP